MYGQRRGLSQGHNLSDNEARDANASLMKTKRRQILLSQLSDKEELYKQYTNPRGIGMRGQTVPQRDIDILYQQIEGIRQQIAALDGVQPSGGMPAPTSAPPSVPPSAHTSYQQQQQPQQQGGNNNPYAGAFQQNLIQAPQSSGGMYSQPQTAGAAPTIGVGIPIAMQQAFPTQSSRAVSGRSSLRDEAWNAKYQKWLAKSQQQPMQHQQRQYMPSQQQQQADFSNSNQFNDSRRFGSNMNPAVGGVPPLHPQTNPSRSNINNQSGAFGYDNGQQQPQFGRRATPPNTGEFNPQQRHPTPTNGMGTNDQQGSFGRRGSGRPW